VEYTAILETTDTDPDLTAALAALTVHLLAVKPTLDRAAIHPDSSLTDDLGFDSLDLVALAGAIRDNHPDFDLRGWLTGACRTGADDVRSLATRFADEAVSHV
jgi:aryl carrier-like protein